MSTSLRVLIVEDSEDDALLMLRALRRGGYDPEFERVDRPEEMEAALEQRTWDIIIADYSMPQFNGLAALRLVQEWGLDLPFIIVSGTIGEDIAVRAMKAGAHDYVMKENLARLIPAIQRELREAEIRRARRKAEEAIRQRTAQLEALREVSLELVAQLDLDILLQSIVSRAIGLLGGIAGGLYLYRPETDLLEWRIGLGPDLPPLGSTLRPGEGLSGRVWETGEPFIVNDYMNWEGRASLFNGLSNVASVGALVRWGDESLGVLNVLADISRPFSQADAEMLSLFAAQAAIAIRNARLYEEAHKRAERLAVVNHIAQAVGATWRLDDLLDTVYREITPIFPSDAFYVALWDEQAGELDFRLQVDEGERLPSDRQPFGKGLTSWVIRERTALLIRDLDHEPEYLAMLELWGSMRSPLSWLGVPMGTGGRVVGVISVQSYQPHAYDEEDQQLLRTIADQVAVAVEKAWLYQTLQESEEKYRQLVEHAGEAIIVEQDGLFKFCNPRSFEITGYSGKELLLKPFSWITHPDDGELFLQWHQKRLQEEFSPQFYSFRIIDKEGQVKWVEINVARIDWEGQPATLNFLNDVTERNQLQEQLRQAQKMEAIGTLAGGIAHDFNNILTGILGYASLLQRELAEDSPLRLDMGTIIRSAERAADLTKQLLTFARRRQQLATEILDLNGIVQETIHLLAHTIDKSILIEANLMQGLQTVKGDANQLHQALLNLCLNARDAMPQGGRLMIATENAFLDEWDTYSQLDISAGPYVVLSVTDTGVGMDDAVRERIFEPFFTTKEHGRGLGLAMVYGIVRGHGGGIHVYSEPGMGTTVKVYLPAHTGGVVTLPERAVELTGGTETVLVVDDEHSVRALMKRILERGGYTVLLAEHGLHAVEIFQQRGSEIDLVVLDLIMPHMGGQETFARLRELAPQVKVLLSSGYSENGHASEMLVAGAGGFLQKPYHMEEVLRKVRQLLDR